MTENALIEKADIQFTNENGTNGRNFVVTLRLKTSYGGVQVKFNPLRLPELLKKLGLEKFTDLEGTYVQISDTGFNEEVKGILSILADPDEEWFGTENNIYFGSDLFKGQSMINELQKENQEYERIIQEILWKTEHNISGTSALYSVTVQVCPETYVKLKKVLEGNNNGW